MKRTWDEDWIDEEDLDIDEQMNAKRYFEQQRMLRNLQDIDEDLLEEDALEEESVEEFWFMRGADKATDESWDRDE